MTLEQYNERKKALQKEIVSLREEFINANRPCDIDELVEITRRDNSKITGIAKSFAILEDGLVYVTSLSIGKSKKKYISKPYKEIKKVDFVI